MRKRGLRMLRMGDGDGPQSVGRVFVPSLSLLKQSGLVGPRERGVAILFGRRGAGRLLVRAQRFVNAVLRQQAVGGSSQQVGIAGAGRRAEANQQQIASMFPIWAMLGVNLFQQRDRLSANGVDLAAQRFGRRRGGRCAGGRRGRRRAR